eukprot:scaffold18608_cov97-Isochrysis_galbana.AAC.7
MRNVCVWASRASRRPPLCEKARWSMRTPLAEQTPVVPALPTGLPSKRTRAPLASDASGALVEASTRRGARVAATQMCTAASSDATLAITSNPSSVVAAARAVTGSLCPA